MPSLLARALAMRLRGQQHVLLWLRDALGGARFDQVELPELRQFLATTQAPLVPAVQRLLPPPGVPGFEGWSPLVALRNDVLGQCWLAGQGDDLVEMLLLPPSIGIDQAALAAWCHEPGIITCQGFGAAAKGWHWAVTRHRDDLLLPAWLASRRTCSEVEALVITAAITETLCSMHSHGVVHGGLEPAWLRVDDTGVALLGQSGLRSFPPAQGALPTDAGDVVAWTAPERASNGELTPGCDIYALGHLLYHILAGRPAFTGDLATVLQAHQHGMVPDLRSSHREISPATAGFIAKTTALQAAARYQSMDAVRNALHQTLRSKGVEPPAPPSHPAVAEATPSQVAAPDSQGAKPTARAPQVTEPAIEMTMAIPGAGVPLPAAQAEPAAPEPSFDMTMAIPPPQAAPAPAATPSSDPEAAIAPLPAPPVDPLAPTAAPQPEPRNRLQGDLKQALFAKNIALVPVTGGEPILLFAGQDLVMGKHRTEGVDAVMRLYPIEEQALLWQRISRQHLRLVLHDGLVWAEDLGSSNGSCVDGAALRAILPAPLPRSGPVELELAGVLRFAGHVHRLQGDSDLPADLPLAPYQTGVRVLTLRRADNRPALQMALVGRHVCIGPRDSDADLCLTQVTNGHALRIGHAAGRWLWQQESEWQILQASDELELGSCRLHAEILQPHHFGV